MLPLRSGSPFGLWSDPASIADRIRLCLPLYPTVTLDTSIAAAIALARVSDRALLFVIKQRAEASKVADQTSGEALELQGQVSVADLLLWQMSAAGGMDDRPNVDPNVEHPSNQSVTPSSFDAKLEVSLEASDRVQPVRHHLPVGQLGDVARMLEVFAVSGCEYLPVLEAERCVGMVSRAAVFEWVVRHATPRSPNRTTDLVNDLATDVTTNAATFAVSSPTHEPKSEPQPTLAASTIAQPSEPPPIQPIQRLEAQLEAQQAHHTTVVQHLQAEIAGYKLLEGKLYSSYMQMQVLLDVMRDVAVIVAVTDDGFDVNIPSSTLFEDPRRSAVVEQAIAAFLAETEPNEFQHSVQEALATEQTIEREHQFEVQNQRLYFEALVSPISDTSVLWVARDITLQKRDRLQLQDYAKRLQQSEIRFRSLFEQAAVGVAQIGLDGRWCLANQKLCDILGRGTPQALVGQRYQDSVYPADRDRDAFAHLLTHPDRHTYTGEQRYLDGEGVVIWVNVTVSLVRDGDGMPQHTVAIVEDIRERKRAARAIEVSEARYRAVVNDQTELICRFTPQGTIVFINPAYGRYFGVTEEQAHGNHLFQVLPGADRTFFAAYLENPDYLANAEQSATLHEWCSRNAAQETVWQQWTVRAIRDCNGALIEIQAVGRDITALKHIEQALKVSQERFCYLLTANPAVVYTCKADNHAWKTFVGDNIRDLLGDAPARWLHDPGVWETRLHPDDVDTVANTLATLHECGHCIMEYRVLHRDGNYRWLRDELKLVIDPGSGQPFEGIGSLVDISNRKRAEAGVLQALEKERELNELKSRFVSMASHEFRTPLAIIQSSAQLLERYELDAEERQEQFEQINDSIAHMNQLLRDVLTLGKAEAGSINFNPEPLPIRMFCELIVGQLQTAICRTHRIVVTIDDRIDDTAIANLDAKLLRQVLTNLLSNAVKYSPQADVVELHVHLDADRLQFRVVDHGIGIPASDLPHLCEAFHRAANVGTIQGTGLGLAIVQRCVSLHGGTISIDSIDRGVNRGTVVTITLPRGNDAEPCDRLRE